MTNDMERGPQDSRRMRTRLLAASALLVGVLGTAWGYHAISTGGPLGHEKRAIAALRDQVGIDVEFDDNGAVVALRANSPAMNDEAVKQLPKFMSLQRLSLNKSGVTDQALETIGRLPNLKSLYLDQTNVTSAGVAKLADCAQLEELMLRETAIDDQALDAIGSLTNLTLLDLSGTQVTDAGMEKLETLTKLNVLYLQSSKVTGQGFSHLAGATKLKLINLNHCAIDAQTIETLQAFPELDRLYLGNSGLNDELLPVLMETLTSHNQKLRGLALPNCPLTDAAVEPLKRLAELPDLAVVDLADSQITKQAFGTLVKATPEINYAVDYPIGE